MTTDHRPSSRKTLKEKLRSLHVGEAEDGLKDAFEALWSRSEVASDPEEHNEEGSEVDRISSGEKASVRRRKKAN